MLHDTGTGGVGVGVGVPPPPLESLPFEQLTKTDIAAKSKTPAAAIGTFFKRALPSSPPPYTNVQDSILLCSS
ncbi:hypothetical protein H0R94_11830 [Treponema socranskii]|uniref:hypothetical protein n=1 Tax=Treponema socranskii TaxID=53419 RepID=UPI003D94147D